MRHAVEMDSGRMKRIPSFMTIRQVIQVLLRFLPQQLERLQSWYY
jgi:hypothetical protein